MARRTKNTQDVGGSDQGTATVDLEAYVPSESICNDDGKIVKMPQDWNPEKHKPIRRKKFADVELYKKWRAENNVSQPRKVKTSFFDLTSTAELCNDNGKLTQIPQDFDSRKFKPLKKRDFASEDIYLEFRADQLTARAEQMVSTADRLRQEAEHFRKFGDDDSRKAIKRASRMKAQLAKLEAQLEEQGISLDDLDL